MPDNACAVVTALNVEGTDADVAAKEISVTADGAEKVITLTATASGQGTAEVQHHNGMGH